MFAEISDIAKRSSELAQNIASAASSKRNSTEKVGRAIKEFWRRRGDETNGLYALDDWIWLNWPKAQASVAQFKLA